MAEACGTSKSQVDKLERGARRLTVDWMVRLAKPLACDPRDLLGLTDAPPSPSGAEGLGGLGPLPVRGLAPLGPSPESGFRMTDSVVDEIPRPFALAHVKDAYALYVLTTDMVPMYRLRQVLLVHPHKPPVTDGGVVLMAPDGTVRIRAFVRAKTGGGLVVRLYQPKVRDETLTAKTLAAVHTIVGSLEPA